MRTFIDYLCLVVAAVMLVASAFFAVNSIATAPAEAATRTISNPCTIGAANGTPSQYHGNLYGTMYVTCYRKLQAHHDRVATVTRIQKWNRQYGKYMNYRPYATNEAWGRGNYSTPHAFAAIRCDGAGLYRVSTGVYTYRSGHFHHTPPSQFKRKNSYRTYRCHGTERQPLHLVNNP